MEKPYKYIEHTADLGIEIVGKTMEDLFINIGNAIFETQVTGDVKVHKQITIEIKAETIEDLFIDWCRELLYYFSVHGFIPKEYKLTLENTSLTAQLSGDVFDPKRHKTKLEIKNPTYHNFSIKKTDAGYQATIIFDV
jgi:SHS2 domain-containing protein